MINQRENYESHDGMLRTMQEFKFKLLICYTRYKYFSEISFVYVTSVKKVKKVSKGNNLAKSISMYLMCMSLNKMAKHVI